MSDRIAVITALSGCSRGEPITSTRPYCLLPVCNRELLLRHIDALKDSHEIVVVYNEQNKRILDSKIPNVRFVADNDAGLRALLGKAIIIPGDLLLRRKMRDEHGYAAAADSSEEEESLKELLRRLGLDVPRLAAEALRVNYPWELLNANQALIKEVKTSVDPSVTIEENVVIKGEVAIGKGSVILSGSYIEGPVVIGEGCEVGPMAHLRPETSIGDGCRIGKSEVVDCVIMRGATSKHHAYLGHSVLGEEANIGAFTVTADYRHDGKSHVTLVHGEKVDTKRRKLGAFLGDRVHTAITTSIYPGRKIWPDGSTLPGEVVTKDKVS